MAYEFSNYSVKVTLVAAADLSAKQYYFVTIDSNGKAAAVSADTDRPVGVLQNAPEAGEEAEVLIVGGTKLVASAAIDEGAILGTASSGKAVTRVVSTDATKYILGTAITAAGADGVFFTAAINCASAARAA